MAGLISCYCGVSFKPAVRNLARTGTRVVLGKLVTPRMRAYCPICGTPIDPVHPGQNQTWFAIYEQEIK